MFVTNPNLVTSYIFWTKGSLKFGEKFLKSNIVYTMVNNDNRSEYIVSKDT